MTIQQIQRADALTRRVLSIETIRGWPEVFERLRALGLPLTAENEAAMQAHERDGTYFANREVLTGLDGSAHTAQVDYSIQPADERALNTWWNHGRPTLGHQIASAYACAQLMTDEGVQMHRQGIRGRRFVVHVNGPKNRVALRIDGQFVSQGLEFFASTPEQADQRAAELERVLALLPLPVPVPRMTPEMQLLTDCGLALYGSLWQSAVARDLRVSDRTVRRWVAGTTPLPAGIHTELLRLTQERAEALDAVAERLKAAT